MFCRWRNGPAEAASRRRSLLRGPRPGPLQGGSEDREVSAGSVIFVARQVGQHRFYDITEELGGFSISLRPRKPNRLRFQLATRYRVLAATSPESSRLLLMAVRSTKPRRLRIAFACWRSCRDVRTGTPLYSWRRVPSDRHTCVTHRPARPISPGQSA